MTMSLDAAAQVMREAMRETVRRHSLWYLVQGGVMIFRRHSGAGLPGSVVVRGGLTFGLAPDHQRVSCKALVSSRRAQRAPFLASACLGRPVGASRCAFDLQSGEGLLVLTLLLLVYFMIEGISKVIFSLTIRPFPNWGWVFASGVVGILVAVYLWASLPVTAIWLLGVLLGIQLICEGAALGYLAWKVRAS